MGFAIPLEHYLVDDSGQGAGAHYAFSEKQVKSYITAAKKDLEDSLTYNVDLTRPLSQRDKDMLIVAALRQHQDRFLDARVVVFGSTSPFFEALALAAGAAHVVTLEYNRLTYSEVCITHAMFFSCCVAALSIGSNAIEI